MTQRKVQVWIVDALGRVLLLKLRTRRGGFWQPVTGGVDAGESSVRAAYRETVEETGLCVLKGPFSAHYSFSFEGRWGRARERVYVLLGEGKVRLSREHSASQWLPPKKARQLLRFKSNQIGLRHALRRAKRMGLLFILAALALGGEATAAQKATTMNEETLVFRLPSRESEVVETLGKGVVGLVNDHPFADERGKFWFRARFGQVSGFVEAREVELSRLLRDSAAVGIAREWVDAEPRSEREWGFQLRLAPSAGVSILPREQALVGAEVEGALNLLLGASGYLRRIVAVCVGANYFPWQQSHLLLTGGMLFRFFGEGLSEPEIRFRAGYDLLASNFLFSPAFAYSLQLGRNPRLHLIWFWELGAWAGSSLGASRGVFVAPYFSTGLGLRF